MSRQEFDLRTLLNLPLWEEVQDQLAKLTGTAIITIDFKGNPITKHSCRTEFCSIIRENPIFRKRCYRCDALAGLEAVRLNRPYIYLCHCGIIDVAVPILVGDRYLGAVMFGQVRLPNNDTKNKVLRLVNEISSFQLEGESAQKNLIEKYQKLPEMEYFRIVEIANLLDSIVHYIVDRAVNNQTQTQTYEWLFRKYTENAESNNITIQEIHAPAKSSFSPNSKFSIPQSSAIYPAVAFIADHSNQTISMSEMAELCHLSPSYFSRLFNRELGENFTNYVNRQKIEIAKVQLRNTTKSVSQISSELGYLNTSHFINLFKRFEGTTPLFYRQYK